MNIIRSIKPDIKTATCPCIEGTSLIRESYSDYLHDESRLSESDVKAIFFPTSTSEISSALQICRNKGWKVTVSGGRTGIVGGAVAIDVDAVLSLYRMKKLIAIGDNHITVESGMTLDEVHDTISTNIPKMFYPVDPTETTATIGGTVATNASGARTYFYGPTRNWVNALTVVLSNGTIIKLRRGENFAKNLSFKVTLSGSEPKDFTFPNFEYPKTKSTAGYEFRDGMDLIDLFIGSEGTLGVISEVELKLATVIENRLYNVIWGNHENQIFDLVDELKNNKSLKILALEYFDEHSLSVLRNKRKSEGDRSIVPKFPEYSKSALFIDFYYEDEIDCITCCNELESILIRCGLNSDDTWSGIEDKDLARMKAFRHALPETINEIISQRKMKNPRIHKLSTDLAVPDGKLREMVEIYHSRLSDTGIEYFIFGHIGDNHLHMNMIPNNDEELEKAKELYREFAVEAVKLGGTIAAEHGIGRIKRDLMTILYPKEILEKMWELKRIFDEDEILNPKVLLPDI